MKRSLIIVPIVLLFGCGSDVGETGDISEVLSTFRLSDTDAVSRTNGWLSQGFPFARGAVAAASILGVKDSDGVTVASRFEPLSYWEDGSVRWALLEFATDYAPDSSALFQVVAGEGGTFAPLPPDLPEIRLEVDRGGDGVTSFVLLDGVSAVEDSLEVEAWVEPVSETIWRIRLRTHQLDYDASWLSYRLLFDGEEVTEDEGALGACGVGGLSVAVENGQTVQRGPIACYNESGNAAVSLFEIDESSNPASFPADEGFRVSHTVYLGANLSAADLAQIVGSPLRLLYETDYVRETMAAGPLSPYLGDEDALSGLIANGMETLREQQDPQSSRYGYLRNTNWVNFGGFEMLAEDKNLNYLGYIKQEYDPATAMILEYLRSGNLEAMDFGLEMVRQYADHGVSEIGGSYQHRISKQALVYAISSQVEQMIRNSWGGGGAYPTQEEYLAWALSWGVTDIMEELLEAGQALEGEELEAFVSEQIGWEAIYGWETGIQSSSSHLTCLEELIGSEGVQRLYDQEDLPRDLAAVFFCSVYFDLLGLSVDDPELEANFEAAYEPHFVRYGRPTTEGWTDFPNVLFFDSPDSNLTHQGAHTLSEMLILGYLLTGSPIYWDSAMDSGRFQATSDMSYEDHEVVEGQIEDGSPVKSRRYGWVLQNLSMFKWLLDGQGERLNGTQYEGLAEQVEERSVWLVEQLASLNPSAHDGSISGGISMTALATYHQESGYEPAFDSLGEIAEYWRDNYFVCPDDAEPTHYCHKIGAEAKDTGPGTGFLALPGMAYYASTVGDDEMLSQIESTLELGSVGSAKVFGMHYRPAPRTLYYLSGTAEEALDE